MTRSLRNPEGLLVEEEDENLRMLRQELPEDSLWINRGVVGLEVLEYWEPEDEEGLRRIRVSRPAGTWTVGALAEAVQVMQTILQGLPELDREDEED